jgi:hypothetical protein
MRRERLLIAGDDAAAAAISPWRSTIVAAAQSMPQRPGAAAE